MAQSKRRLYAFEGRASRMRGQHHLYASLAVAVPLALGLSLLYFYSSGTIDETFVGLSAIPCALGIFLLAKRRPDTRKSLHSGRVVFGRWPVPRAANADFYGKDRKSVV